MTTPLQAARLRFKEEGDLAKLAELDFRIHFLLDLSVYYACHHCSPTVMVTDVDTRLEVRGRYSPHYFKRAVDLGLRPLGLELWEGFAAWVNEEVLDYGRGFRAVLVGLYDPTGRHDDHVHLQVPPPYCRRGRLKLDCVRKRQAPRPDPEEGG